MITHFPALLRRAALALTLALAAHGAAHAGLVTGNWDPQFGGTALPNLSWQARTQWLVPNACSNQADGIYSTSLVGPCQSTLGDPVVLLGVWLRWFDTGLADPNDFYTNTANSQYFGYCVNTLVDPTCGFTFAPGSEPLMAAQIRVEQNQVVAFDTGITPLSSLTFGLPASAGTNQFDLKFTTNGPTFQCVTCSPADFAATQNLSQVIVTYTSNNNSAPKFTNGNGQTLGAALDGTGKYLGQAVVPEPGTLSLLIAAALGAAAIARRRRV